MYCYQEYNGEKGGVVYPGCWAFISFIFDYYLAQKWDFRGVAKNKAGLQTL